MKVWGIEDLGIVRGEAMKLGLVAENMRWAGRAIAFKASPESSRSEYARRSVSGRRLRAACYHGFLELMRALYSRGATRIQSAMFDGNASDLEAQAWEIAHRNIGSEARPCLYIETCDHEWLHEDEDEDEDEDQ